LEFKHAYIKLNYQGKDLSAIVSRTYIPFGSGSRLCVGAEFVKLKMAIFIHHLSRYRFIYLSLNYSTIQFNFNWSQSLFYLRFYTYGV